MQYIINNRLIREIDKSLKKGPVIKKKGNNENRIVGILKKISFCLIELKVIN